METAKGPIEQAAERKVNNILSVILKKKNNSNIDSKLEFMYIIYNRSRKLSNLPL